MPRNVSILIVDDKAPNLLALEAVLEAPGYELVRATSGYQAVRLVRERDFAAILLDVQMPGMDGYETAKQIKSLERGKNVPIMFVTAVYKEDEDVRKGYRVGGLDYFTKPFIPEVIKAKVQIYADLHRLTHEVEQHRRLLEAIKDRNAAEKALDALMESVSEGVIITDAAGHVTRTNMEAQRIWGGATPRPLRHMRELEGRWAATGKKLEPDEWGLPRAGELVLNEPIEIRCFDGSRKTIVESANALKENDVILGVVIVMKAVPDMAPKLPPPRDARRYPDLPS